jgi:hypothetical protein
MRRMAMIFLTVVGLEAQGPGSTVTRERLAAIQRGEAELADARIKLTETDPEARRESWRMAEGQKQQALAGLQEAASRLDAAFGEEQLRKPSGEQELEHALVMHEQKVVEYQRILRKCREAAGIWAKVMQVTPQQREVWQRIVTEKPKELTVLRESQRLAERDDEGVVARQRVDRMLEQSPVRPIPGEGKKGVKR